MKRLDHVGIIVADLAAAKRFAIDVLGLASELEVDLPEQSVTAAFFTLGEARLEFIEVTDPELRRQRLGDTASARIEHVAVEVDDLEAIIAELAAKGVRTTSHQPWTVGANRNLFTIPETTGGVIYQFFDHRAGG